MRIDLVGRVTNTKLPSTHGLLPLFEAVVNSIHAIEDAHRSEGVIDIRVRRHPVMMDELHGNTLAEIAGFSVSDNGVGFTEKNFASFDTMDSRSKVLRGGKGVGRLLWLKAFEGVAVDSVYEEDGAWWQRTFDFVLSADGIENAVSSRLARPPADSCTTVRLNGFFPRYQRKSPKRLDAVARRIVEHCLEYYLVEQMPRVILTDEDGSQVDLSSLYQNEFYVKSRSRAFSVQGQELTLVDVLLKYTGDLQHTVHYCGQRRVVQSVQLHPGDFPHLATPLRDEDDNGTVYFGYVTGEFLDSRVDQERTGFEIDQRDDLAIHGGVSWNELHDATLKEIAAFLNPLTEEVQRASMRHIETFIETKEPQYKLLLKNKRAELERLSGFMSEDKLDLALYQLLSTWRGDVRQEAGRLQRVGQDESFDAYQEEVARILADLQEIAKSDLAQYVVHRAAILRFFDQLLSLDESGKAEREDTLHEVFFPRHRDSSDVPFDDHNLWIIDERLAYHRYLASDMPFAQQTSPVEVESKDRPDIIVYNTPKAFVPGGAPFSSVVIVEFKRPERKDVRKGESPIRQVLRYIEQIREGKARRPGGETVEPPPDVPFYCYVIATLTPQLRQEAREMGFTEAPDRTGFFHYNQNYKAYIEVSSYRKVVEDAKKRNRAFFDRLQIRLS